MLRNRLFVIGVICAVIACFAIAAFLVTRPTTLRFAVGPPGSEAVKLVEGLRTALARERSSVRLRVLVGDSPADGALRLQRGEADLAIVRTDVSFPEEALGVAIWQRNPIVLTVDPRAKIERWTDLAGKSIGVLGRGIGLNLRLLETILREHGVPPTAVRLVELLPWEVEGAVRTGAIQGLVTIGPVAARPIADGVGAMVRALDDGKVAFVPIRENAAIADRVPFLEQFEVVPGAFGSNPPRPADPLPSLAVLNFLVANRSLPDGVVAELTQQLFTLRPLLAIQHPTALRIEVPETEKGSSVQLHPGALAYLTGDQKGFLERYADFLYLTIFGLSLAGSAFAGLASYFGFGRREQDAGRLPDVLVLVREARATDDPAMLDAIARSADDIFVEAINRSKQPKFDRNAFAILTLSLDHLNSAIADRRRALAMQEDDEAGDAPQGLHAVEAAMAPPLASR